MIKHIKDAGDLKGKRVLVRVDFNVPVIDGKVTDDFRIERAMPTIEFLKTAGARTILISHCEGGTETLRPMFDYLRVKTGGTLPTRFCEDYITDAKCFDDLKDGDVVLCENVRLWGGEKKNDPEFAKQLASLADIYVDDAFAVMHRKHASVVGVPKLLPSYEGFLVHEEREALTKCFSPAHPFLFILGGAKFETKEPLLQKFGTLADMIFVGGALAHDFYKAKGLNVGRSLVSDAVIDQTMIANPKFVLPSDVVVENVTSANVETKTPDQISDVDNIVDAGEATVADLRKLIADAKFVLWNGPLGNYERGFKNGTKDLAKLLAQSSATTIVGGGDTLAAITELGVTEKFIFVSTGGGAMLDFLATETLPGIEALV